MSSREASLLSIIDPIHGSIDTRDLVAGPHEGIISRILTSPEVQRLQRIKQLGFVPLTYTAADHSRYAHALGTMQVMRKLFNRLSQDTNTIQQMLPSLRIEYPHVFSGDTEQDCQILGQYMLVAALLQDIGEPPYSQATKGILRPSTELCSALSRKLGVSVSNWNTKAVFTAAFIYSKHLSLSLDSIDLGFLIDLIAGTTKRRELTTGSLLPLWHMIDGAIDADRLDYVFRDAHHTLGGLGSSEAVIETLLYYDAIGPVVSDPSPVSNLLATRAYLHSTVYHAPVNRFRIRLLITLLREVVTDAKCAEIVLGAIGNECSVEDYLELDDVSLMRGIRELSDSKMHRTLSEKAKVALGILAGGHVEYYNFWLAPPVEQSPALKLRAEMPDDLFFDNYDDQIRPLYKLGSVRVQNERYKHIAELVPLEQCGGPFIPMLKEPSAMLPMPKSILVFVPRTQHGIAWKEVNQALNDGTLYQQLRDATSYQADFPMDTRERPGHDGPAIFISFTWADIGIVRKLARELNKRRRRYYLFGDDVKGIGTTPIENSVRAVSEAEAVIIMASSTYGRRYRDVPDGFIANEIFAMSHRVVSENLPIVVLSTDSSPAVESMLPWSALGFKAPPFIGTALQEIEDAQQFSAVIDEILQSVDTKFSSARDT